MDLSVYKSKWVAFPVARVGLDTSQLVFVIFTVYVHDPVTTRCVGQSMTAIYNPVLCMYILIWSPKVKVVVVATQLSQESYSPAISM